MPPTRVAQRAHTQKAVQSQGLLAMAPVNAYIHSSYPGFQPTMLRPGTPSRRSELGQKPSCSHFHNPSSMPMASKHDRLAHRAGGPPVAAPWLQQIGLLHPFARCHARVLQNMSSLIIIIFARLAASIARGVRGAEGGEGGETKALTSSPSLAVQGEAGGLQLVGWFSLPHALLTDSPLRLFSFRSSRT